MKVRYIQFVVLFISFTFAMLVSTTVLIVLLPMTDDSIHNGKIPTLNWDKSTKGLITSSLAWGEAVTQFFTGFIVHKYESKNISTLCLLGMGIFSILQPSAVGYVGLYGMYFCNIVNGIFAGFLGPCIHSLLGKWTPLNERNRASNYVYAGEYVANIMAGPLVGAMSGSVYGWPSVFYVVGGLCLSASVLLFLFLENSPAEHKKISDHERAYIARSLNREEYVEKTNIPWKSILTSVPVWALIFTEIGTLGGYAIIAYEGPTFFNSALGIDTESSAFLTALPYIASLITMLAASTIGDIFVNKSILSLTATRKIFNSIGTFLPAILLIVVIVTPKTETILILGIWITIFGLDGFNCSGYCINHIDLSPTYSGVLSSASRSCSNIFGLMLPIITGAILQDPTDLFRWKIVLAIGVCSYCMGNIIFLIWGSAQVQPWDNQNEVKKTENGGAPLEMKPLNEEIVI